MSLIGQGPINRPISGGNLLKGFITAVNGTAAAVMVAKHDIGNKVKAGDILTKFVFKK